MRSLELPENGIKSSNLHKTFRFTVHCDLLPLNKWADTMIRGKILHDTVDTIALLSLRKEMKGSGISTSEIFDRTQSLMCSQKSSGIVTTEGASCSALRSLYCT